MRQLRVRRRLVPAAAVAGAVAGGAEADVGPVGTSGSRLRLAGTLSAGRGDGEGTETSVIAGAANAKGMGAPIPGNGVGARSFGFTEGRRRALAVRAADSESGEDWAVTGRKGRRDGVGEEKAGGG